MRKIPPNGVFSMQSVVVDDFRVINKVTNMFPGLPNRLEDTRAMDRDREGTNHKVTKG